MTTTLQFETETCTRCGGCGRYSHCEMYGDTCFKCHGKGKQLSRRAVVARDRMIAARQIRLGDVRPGMVIRSSGSTYNVQSIKQDTVSSGKSLRDGVWVDHAPSLHIQGIKHGLSAWADFIVELVPSKAEQIEQLRAAIAYQNTLTKAGTVRKSTRIVEAA